MGTVFQPLEQTGNKSNFPAISTLDIIHTDVLVLIYSMHLTGKVGQSARAGPQQEGQAEEAAAPVFSLDQARPAQDPHPCPQLT